MNTILLAGCVQDNVESELARDSTKSRESESHSRDSRVETFLAAPEDFVAQISEAWVRSKESVSLPMDTPAWQENQVDLSYVWAISYSHLNSYKTQLNMSYKQNGKSEQFLETAYPRQRLFQFKRHSVSATGANQ